MTDTANLEWSNGALQALRTEMSKALVGQTELVEALAIALIAGQHVLIEGVPGVAKTLAVRSLGKVLALDFQRIQFTPDLLPSDLVGTQIFNPQKADFAVKKGPVFANLVLADEINRAPAKVQSALLEAMEEKQVTLGDTSYPLPGPFLVLATENPIEQEGTYPLPEAQLDRFMFKILVEYPSRTEELEVLRLKKQPTPELSNILSHQDLKRISDLASAVHIEGSLEEYIVDLVRATRPGDSSAAKLGLENTIRWGAGPRAVVFFLAAARARAVWKGRSYVVPEDVQALAKPILRHRILLSYEALADGTTVDQVIETLIKGIKAP